MFPQIN